MASRKVCDTEPCEKLMEGLRKFFVLDSPYDPEKGILVLEARKKKGNSLERLNFRYCPFCGTRVTKGAVEDLVA